MQDLAGAVRSGDTLALARAISLVERATPEGEALLAGVFRHAGRARVLGVTGPPGVGKSTLVSRMVGHYRASGHSVGVVAVDPSSAFSGGAILGDRVRMQEHALDPSVFIRSMASRGSHGGLARATRDAVDLIDASGRDPILIETVGVGQDEVDVVRAADTVLVVLTPGQGDDIQAIKAGILEIADIFVINKADHPGVARLTSELEAMLALGEPGGWRPPIMPTVASDGSGIAELADAIGNHTRYLLREGALSRRRAIGLSTRLLEILRENLVNRLITDAVGGQDLEAYGKRLAERLIDPYTAANEVMENIGSERNTATTVLDHLGIAVSDIDQRVSLYQELLGLELTRVETVASEGVRVAMLPAGRTRIELVEPLDEGSTVARFISKRGEGIHHICFQVGDLDLALSRFREAGLLPAGAGDRPGAEGSRVAFIHPKGTGGILIELREGGSNEKPPTGPRRTRS